MPGTIMPSLRNSRRSSRNSSPAVRAVAENSPQPEPRSESRQLTLPGLWRTEPPLKTPAPSFEDYGIERHGVLNNMAPLGTLPPAKLRLTMNNANKKKLSLGKAFSAAASPAPVATPEVTPPVERRVDQSERDEQPPAKRLRTEEKEDISLMDDVADQKMDITPLASPLPTPKIATPQTGHSRRHSISSKSPSNSPIKKSIYTRPIDSLKDHDDAVKAAMLIAEQRGQPKLGAYLKIFYEQSYTDQRKAEIVDNIYRENSTDEDLQIFKEALLAARAKTHREGREFRTRVREQRQREKEEEALRKSNQQSPTTPISPVRPSNNKPTTPLLKSPLIIKERSVAKPSRISSRKSSMANGGTTTPSDINGMTTRTSSRRQTRTSAVVKEVPEELVEPVVPPSPVVQTPPNQTGRRTTRSKKRERADSSSSDLSSVDEELVENGPPNSLGVGAKRNALEAEIDLIPDEQATRRADFDGDLHQRRAKFDNPTISFIRKSLGPPSTGSGIKISFNGGRSTRSNVQRAVREGSEAMVIDTPQPSPNTQGLAAGNLRSSRSLGPPDLHSKKRTGARTKISPVKDRSTVAGVPRNSARYASLQASRQASPSRGNMSDDEELDDLNSDYCTACGEPGKLLCCDGCTNAFHFKCCDPPIRKDAASLDEPYYCFSCLEAGRGAPEEPEAGVFGELFDNLKGTNVASFQLPRSLQSYFKGTAAKENGEYADTSIPQVPLRVRNTRQDGEVEIGQDGRPKEKTQICIVCKQSSLGGKTIIQCDSCGSQWHLDCLDPPQANPPKPSNNGKTRPYFRCPRHIDQDLRLIGDPKMAYTKSNGLGFRGHKLRPVANPAVYTPVIQRGHRNNGMIEVELEEEVEAQENSAIPKLKERNITLDFIEKARRERLEREYRAKQTAAISQLQPHNFMTNVQHYVSEEVSRLVQHQVQAQMAEFTRQQQIAQREFLTRPLEEQRMALFLLKFADDNTGTGNEANNLSTLARAVSAVDPVSGVNGVSVDELRTLSSKINDAIAAAELAKVGDHDDLFDHDILMGNAEEPAAQTSLEQPSPAVIAAIDASIEDIPSPLPSIRSNAKTVSPQPPTTEETCLSTKQATPPTNTEAAEEEPTSGGSSASLATNSSSTSIDIGRAAHRQRTTKPSLLRGSPEAVVEAPEEEAACLPSPTSNLDKSLAEDPSPSTVPSLASENPYDAEESAAEQSEASISGFAKTQGLWGKQFVEAEREGEQDVKRDESPDADEGFAEGDNDSLTVADEQGRKDDLFAAVGDGA